MTELAVIEPTDDDLLLKEVAAGVTIDEVRRATQADLIVPDRVLEMPA